VGVKDRARRFVETRAFQNTIIAFILVNAVVLGLETVPEIREDYGELLRGINYLFLITFIAEITVRVWVHGRAFFRDPWSVFDLVVVGIAMIPPQGPFTVLRVMRVLRLLWLLSAIPSLRRVVAGVLRAIPGMVSIGVLLVLLMYGAGVMATLLFQDTNEEYFGTLGASLFSLFQVMTGESWAEEIARPTMAQHPMAWIFFVSFILLSTFVVLNWFIAVAVDAFETVALGDDDETDYKGEAHASRQVILREVKALRTESAELREAVSALHAEVRRLREPESPQDP
jgi:voltage-gated sodium channel